MKYIDSFLNIVYFFTYFLIKIELEGYIVNLNKKNIIYVEEFCNEIYCEGPIFIPDSKFYIEPSSLSDAQKVCQFVKRKNINLTFDGITTHVSHIFNEKKLKFRGNFNCSSSSICKYTWTKKYEKTLVRCYFSNFTCKLFN